MTQSVNPNSSGKFREFSIVFLIFAAAIILFWWRVWIPSPPDRMHFTDDILIKDYPTRMGLFRQVLDGRLPLWDPYQFGGWPGLANCEAGIFYPLNWPLIPCANSPELAFQVTQWIVLLHFFIAGLGTYRYARYLGLSPLGAGFSAMSFMFCGFLCAHKKHTNMVFTLVWFPWLLLQAERWIRARKSQFLFRMTLLLGLSFLAGHPQSSLYLTLVLTARLMMGIFERNPDPFCRQQWFTRGLAPILGVLMLAASLSAVQYLPTRELIQQSERAEADTFQRSSEFSLPPSELLEAFLPEAFSQWSQIEVFYWGLIPLLLALHAVQRGGFQSLDKYFMGLFVMAILLSLGEYLFVFDLSYLLIPGSAWVRAPSRWIFFAGLPLVMMAGKEIDYIIREDRQILQKSLSSSYWNMIAGLTAMMTLIFLYVVIASDVSIPIENKLAVRRELFQTYLYMLFFGGSFLILYHLTIHQRLKPTMFAIATILIGWIDLGTHYHSFELKPGTGGYRNDTEVEILHQAVWNHRTKVFFEAGGNRELYHGAAQNFYELDGQSPLTPRLHLELREDTSLPFPDKPNTRLLRLLGVGAVLTDSEGFPPDWEEETQRLYRIESHPNRAMEFEDEFFADWETQREILRLQSFPFHQVVVRNSETQSDSPEGTFHPLFPKPFLLASCSILSVSPAAFLVIDGENHFAELTQETAGYCFAIADPVTGEIEETQIFNLMTGIQDPEHREHRRMLQFIQEIPDGKIVFAAVKDNATNALLPTGLAALRSIGASLDARGMYRVAHTILGRKGAPIGSALEIYSATEALVLQTTKSLTIEGRKIEKLDPTWMATTNLADTWNTMLSEIDPDRNRPLQYNVSDEIRNSTNPLSVTVPITIFSAPKKEVSFPTIDKAEIRIANHNYALNQRGYNLVVVEPQTFHVVESESFDLFKDYDSLAAPKFIRPASPENNRLCHFIRSVTDGYLILGAIRDDATDLMTPATLDMLHEIGSAMIFDMTDSQARKRISHAFIAVKGITPCIEAFAKEKDAIVFTRYPGGPALSHSELKVEGEVFVPTNPVHEMEAWIDSKRQDSTKNALLSNYAIVSEYPSQPWAIVRDSISRIVLSGQSRKGGIVFLNEIFFPGWVVFVDGIHQPIERVNYYFRGIPVEPGLHEIELIYSPPAFFQGAILSAIALLILLGWWVVLRFHSKANE